MKFKQLADANLARAKGSQMEFWQFGADFFAMELAGETGELCNVTKKLARLRILGEQHPMNKRLDPVALKANQVREIGDVCIVLDLFCQSLGYNLATCVMLAFNEKSKQIGSTVFIPADSAYE